MLLINPLFLFIWLFFSSPETPLNQAEEARPVFESEEGGAWADSLLYRMSLRQKIGQLFMVAAYPDQGSSHEKEITDLIRDYQIGGLIFFKGSPHRLFSLQNKYQNIAQIPLMIGIDGEWGVSMRLDSTIKYPRQMTLGAISDEELIYEFGRQTARDCKRLGIQINFAPVVDINNNPANPVINTRSFGDNREQVARKGIMYMKGMQDEGVMACAKHFPGHGNTSVDSHQDLPQLPQSLQELDSIEFYPFRSLINAGVASIMVAHLNIPAMDDSKNRASTLSQKIVSGWLKDSMNFKGLIITDALNMQGVAKYFKPGEVDLEAFKAGNDILLFPQNVPQAVEMIEQAIIDSIVPVQMLNARVRKILMAKHWACLPYLKTKNAGKLIHDLNKPHAQLLNSQLYRSAITLLRNRNEVLPLSIVPEQRIASVVINDEVNNFFQKQLRHYDAIDVYKLSANAGADEISRLSNRLKEYDRVILSFHNVSTSISKNFGITASMRSFCDELLLYKVNVIAVMFGNPYALDKIRNLKNCHGLFLAYEENKQSQYHTARMIFGKDAPSGKLPVSLESFERGEGLSFQKHSSILNFIPAWEQGILTDGFSGADSIIEAAIDSQVMPGCQLLVALRGDVLYHKAFGYHSYDSLKPVDLSDIYDVASITKIAATALAVMKLYEEGKINIDEKASFYLPELKASNKKDMVLREIWTHQSGLFPWIPFWRETLDKDGRLNAEIYSTLDDRSNYYQITDSLFIKKSYSEEIWEQVIKADNRKNKEYKYSDLGMIITRRIVERITGEAFDDYLRRNFYEALELDNLLFRPLEKISRDRIVPTEKDTLFRKSLIHGYVHDPGAAMTNGVDGHAGLFANSKDLAELMQMLLQKGSYGGSKFFDSTTVQLFTQTQYPGTKNRRALIFDKPQADTSEIGPSTYDAPLSSFGHSGFTGAYTWVDPENELLIVFLTNRIHPHAENNKLTEWNIRTKIQQAIYDDLGRGRFKAEQKHF